MLLYKHNKLRNEECLTTIDKANNIPLYLQLMSIFTENIRTGQWPMGEKIPSERELVTQYGVSLITVRKALEELNRLNVIYKIQGKGSFVSYGETEKYNLRFRELRSFTEEIEGNQQKAGAVVLSTRKILADSHLAHVFQLPEKTVLLEVIRLRTVDGTPTHVSESYIGPVVAEKLKNADFTHSIYAEIEQLGYDLRHGSEEIIAAFPPAEVAGYLGISSNTPILDACCTVTDGGSVLLYTHSYINSKRMSITVDLSRTDNQ